eukprot:CAMPEP_0183354812 /NCGR_PEP_ID=MMETSP0164_2-20130417/38243_1 /TAXON_ID=221442 /ORGANISM="Coccolithus pelagicus ssp braarudi, Strain PLY182g" /LENGTH=492 /DNA_ID=CAMNT_0025527765 /DNA_START=11 /DNA_END=1489 /DNA_ORIENTATION=-
MKYPPYLHVPQVRDAVQTQADQGLSTSCAYSFRTLFTAFTTLLTTNVTTRRTSVAAGICLSLLLLLPWLFSPCRLLLAPPQFNEHLRKDIACSISIRPGHRCDGSVDDSAFLQSILATCAERRQSVVLRTNCNCTAVSLWLPSHSTLAIEHGAQLQAAPPHQWVACRWPTFESLLRIQPRIMPGLLSASDAHNITLSGGGVLNGNGAQWWPRTVFAAALARPRLIQFENTTNVLIENLTLLNPAFWSASLGGSQYTIRDIVVRAPAWREAPNTDGIDVAATNVHITRVDISNGDDSICIKSPSANVLVEDSVVREGNGLVIGTVWSGLERDDPWEASVHNVTFRNCVALDTTFGAHVKYYPPQHGRVSNVTYENIQIYQTKAATSRRIDSGDHAGYAIGIHLFDQGRRQLSWPWVSATPPCVRVSNVTFRNITGDVLHAGEFICSGAGKIPACQNVMLQDIHLTIPQASGDCIFRGVTGKSEGHIWPSSCAL